MKEKEGQTCNILVWEVCEDDTDLLSSLSQSKQHRLWTYWEKIAESQEDAFLHVWSGFMVVVFCAFSFFVFHFSFS